MNRVNPFTWGFDEYDMFESKQTQLNAKYKDVPDNVFDNTEAETYFHGNNTSASANIAEVCDMDSACSANP